MKKGIIISLLSIGVLTACGNDSDELAQNESALTTTQKIVKMKDSGELPKLERTNTVWGIDADKNGIRDDIDAYIKKTYPSEEQQKAVNCIFLHKHTTNSCSYHTSYSYSNCTNLSSLKKTINILLK